MWLNNSKILGSEPPMWNHSFSGCPVSGTVWEEKYPLNVTSSPVCHKFKWQAVPQALNFNASWFFGFAWGKRASLFLLNPPSAYLHLYHVARSPTDTHFQCLLVLCGRERRLPLSIPSTLSTTSSPVSGGREFHKHSLSVSPGSGIVWEGKEPSSQHSQHNDFPRITWQDVPQSVAPDCVGRKRLPLSTLSILCIFSSPLYHAARSSTGTLKFWRCVGGKRASLYQPPA